MKKDNLHVALEYGDALKNAPSFVPKQVYIHNQKVKKVFYNGKLIWQNDNLFKFIKNLNEIDPNTKLPQGTIIFQGFSSTSFDGNYESVTDLSEASGEPGRVIVVDGGNN